MALAATNAHLNHFYTLDLPQLMLAMDDDALDKCRGFMINLLECESNSLSSFTEAVSKASQQVENSSADVTNQLFLQEATSNCLRETIQIEFEPVDNDVVTICSTEYNQDLALETEITKWMSCFQKECRNKTVEVRGTGQVNLESQIDEVKQLLRKCDISKAKAYARLMSIKESGMPIEDLDTLEANINHEMSQSSNMLDVDASQQPLSRTPSLRSAGKLSDDGGRASAAETKSFSDNDNENPTPVPDNYMSRSQDYDDDSDERDMSTPAPTANNNQQQYDNGNQQGWTESEWGDPTAVPWDAAPAAAESTGYGDTGANQAPIQEEVSATAYAGQEAAEANDLDDQYDDQTQYDQGQDYDQGGYDQQGSLDQSADYGDQAGYEQTDYDQQAPVDGTQMVNKICRAVYAYEGQNEDELVLQEGEEITVVAAADADWVTGQNSQGQVGYVPAAYLEIVADAPQVDEYADYDAPPAEVPPSEPLPEPSMCVATASPPSYKPPTTQVVVSEQPGDEYVRALYDYEATSHEEITFNEGDVFRVIEKSDDGWWTGEKDGIVGHFPSMVVEELDGDEVDEEEEESEASGGPPGMCPASPVAPPPSFAPPKPVHLTPHEIVIMGATPVVEHKEFGEQEEIDAIEEVSADDGIGEENSDDNTENVVVSVPVPPAPDNFTLDNPPKKPTDDSTESKEEEGAPALPVPELPPPAEEDDEPELPPPPPPAADDDAQPADEAPADEEPPPPFEANFEANFEDAGFEANFEAKFEANFDEMTTDENKNETDKVKSAGANVAPVEDEAQAML